MRRILIVGICIIIGAVGIGGGIYLWESNHSAKALSGGPVTIKFVASGDYSRDPKEEAKKRTYEALNMMLNDNIDGALANLDAAIKADPDAIMAYVLRAEIHARRKEWDAADQEMDKALQLRPDNPSVQMGVADMKLRRGAFNEARKRYTEIAPSSQNADIINFKILLCDLGSKQSSAVSQDMDAFKDETTAGYAFAHAANAIDQGNVEDARAFIKTAALNHSQESLKVYMAGLDWIGYMTSLRASIYTH